MEAVWKFGQRVSKIFSSKVGSAPLLDVLAYAGAGLRKYWESPYATLSQSCDRSRWRNQFLVDYLKSTGVERSKKQVASHIQVLRNLWKGKEGLFVRQCSSTR